MITIVLALIAMVLIYLAAAAYVPRWWAHRIADAVDGKLSTGTLLEAEGSRGRVAQPPAPRAVQPAV